MNERTIGAGMMGLLVRARVYNVEWYLEWFGD